MHDERSGQQQEDRVQADEIRYIFTFALDQVEAPDLLRDRWQVYGTRPECLQVIIMQLRKRWLAESRAVCVLWRRAGEF